MIESLIVLLRILLWFIFFFDRVMLRSIEPLIVEAMPSLPLDPAHFTAACWLFGEDMVTYLADLSPAVLERSLLASRS